MINHRKVVDKLQSLILNSYKAKFWLVEYSEYYNIKGETVKLINLLDNGSDNKYGLYHSTLDDSVESNMDLFRCCINNLEEHYDNIRDVMNSIIDSGLIVVNVGDISEMDF